MTVTELIERLQKVKDQGKTVSIVSKIKPNIYTLKILDVVEGNEILIQNFPGACYGCSCDKCEKLRESDNQ